MQNLMERLTREQLECGPLQESLPIPMREVAQSQPSRSNSMLGHTHGYVLSSGEEVQQGWGAGDRVLERQVTVLGLGRQEA